MYAAKNESLVGSLSEKFVIGEAEFTVEEIITSEYLEVDLSHHGEHSTDLKKKKNFILCCAVYHLIKKKPSFVYGFLASFIMPCVFVI